MTSRVLAKDYQNDYAKKIVADVHNLTCASDFKYDDFPDAKSIKSMKPNEQREQNIIKIQYPKGFEFGYDKEKERYGYFLKESK